MSDDARLAALQDGSAWDDFCEHLKRAGRNVIDRAPEDVARCQARDSSRGGIESGHGFLSVDGDNAGLSGAAEQP